MILTANSLKSQKNDFRIEIKDIFKRPNRAYSYPCVLSNLQSGRSLK